MIGLNFTTYEVNLPEGISLCFRPSIQTHHLFDKPNTEGKCDIEWNNISFVCLKTAFFIFLFVVVHFILKIWMRYRSPTNQQTKWVLLFGLNQELHNDDNFINSTSYEQ